MKVIKLILKKNKALLKKLDRFALSKASVEDGHISYASSLGGILSILFYLTIVGIITYYLIIFFNGSIPTVSQSQISAQSVDFSNITTAEKISYNKTFGVNVTIDSVNFDFAVFFPWSYNNTLDILFNGGSYNPMAAYGNFIDPICKLPYYLVLSHFSAYVIGDVDDPNNNQGVAVPMQFVGNSYFGGHNGRLYAPLYLNNMTLGANFKIDIILELARSTDFYISDFIPAGTTQNINYVYFLYREYTFDAAVGYVAELNSYQLSYFPPGSSGSNINSCTQVILSPNIIQITKQQGILDQTFTHIYKFASWSVTSNLYYYKNLFGLCPTGSTSPYSNGTTSSTGIGATHCINTASNGYSLIPYQPFKITITGSKYVTTIKLSYDDPATLIAVIGGTLTLAISIFAGAGKFLNSYFYSKEVKQGIKDNIENKELKIMDISNLDEEEKTVLIYSMNKKKKSAAKLNMIKLKERDSHIDKLILDEFDEESRAEKKNVSDSNTVNDRTIDKQLLNGSDLDFSFQNHDIEDSQRPYLIIPNYTKVGNTFRPKF